MSKQDPLVVLRRLEPALEVNQDAPETDARDDGLEPAPAAVAAVDVLARVQLHFARPRFRPSAFVLARVVAIHGPVAVRTDAIRSALPDRCVVVVVLVPHVSIAPRRSAAAAVPNVATLLILSRHQSRRNQRRVELVAVVRLRRRAVPINSREPLPAEEIARDALAFVVPLPPLAAAAAAAAALRRRGTPLDVRVHRRDRRVVDTAPVRIARRGYELDEHLPRIIRWRADHLPAVPQIVRLLQLDAIALAKSKQKKEKSI